VTDLPPPPPPPPPPPWNPPPSGGGDRTPDAGAALSYGWQKFQQNVGALLIAVLIPIAVQVVLSIIGRAVVSSFFVAIVFQIIGIALSAAAGIGIYRVALQITAGEPADIGKAFDYDRWGEWIIFSILFGLMVGIGLVLCIVPGLFVLAFFGLAPFFFIDKRMSLGEALTASRMAVQMKGLAFPILLSIVVGFLGIILCFLGVLITEPIAYVAVAFLYRYAVGQSVAA
jgi:uncharacterized membrane protein